MTLLFVDSNAALRGARTTWLRDNLPGYTIVDFPGPSLAAAWIAKADSLDILVTEAIFPTAGNRICPARHGAGTLSPGARAVQHAL
jgi:hypothetical protein